MPPPPASAYHPEIPETPYPVIIVGAGGIVRDAHLPAYAKAALPVWGVVDQDAEKARALATENGIGHAFGDLREALASSPANAVFDVATPASAFPEILSALPEGAHVLLQKPMGENLGQAREILGICHARNLFAAVNCQLRYAPFVTKARDLIDAGTVGDLLDLEMRLNVYTPWGLFPFLEGLPRVEMLYHSVHYVDLIRSFFGEPRSVMARTVPHPALEKLASVRSTLILDYPNPLRAQITANHNHDFGPRHQESYLKWEGTRGAIKARIGLLMNYPTGTEDVFEYRDSTGDEADWQRLDLDGSWFPDAFVGTMAALQEHKAAIDAGEAPTPMPCSADDVLQTMACLEAAYESDRVGGIRPGSLL